MATLKSVTKPTTQPRSINLDGNWYNCSENVWQTAQRMRLPAQISDGFSMNDQGQITYINPQGSQPGYNQNQGGYNRQPKKNAHIEESARLRRRTDCYVSVKDLIIAGKVEMENWAETAEQMFNNIEHGFQTTLPSQGEETGAEYNGQPIKEELI